MAAIFLINDPRWTWREWLKSELRDRPLVCLDVASAEHGPAGRVYLQRKGKTRSWRFVGSVHANRNPVDLVSGARSLMAEAGGDCVVLGFEMHEFPLLRQMAITLAEASGKAEVLAPTGSAFVHEPWPCAVTQVDTAESLPEAARLAQRRARWLEMIESCSEHTLSLDKVGVYGARLGGGTRLQGHPFTELGAYVERYGSTMLVVTDGEPEGSLVTEATNLAHVRNVVFVAPTAYDGLVCSFVRGCGEDFGMGVIKSVDFVAREMTVLNTAVPPAPLRMVRIGSIRIDMDGKESGETKPWAV